MKKMDKMKKFLLAAFAISIVFFAAVGISLNVMTACAEESTENTEILDDSAMDEEVIDSEETSENSGVLDEETDNSAVLDEIKNYIDSRTDENGKINWNAVLTDAKFWIIKALEALGITGVCSLVIALVNRKNRKDNVLTEAHVERIATAAAKKTAANVIGKSIDVDISAEVSKAVKQELYALSNGVASLVDGVKNTEMLVANVALAQSRSRLLTNEEKQALQHAAETVQEHAGKKVVSTGKIELTAAEPKTETKVDSAPTESVEEKNIYFINFNGVKKQ